MPRPRSAGRRAIVALGLLVEVIHFCARLDPGSVTMKIALDPTPFHHDYELLRIPATGGRSGLRVPATHPAPRLHPVLQPSPRRRRSGGFRPSAADGVRGRLGAAGAALVGSRRGTPARAAVPLLEARHQITRGLGVNVINTEFSGDPNAPRSPNGASSGPWRNSCRSSSVRHRRPDRPAPDDFVEDGLEAVRIIRGVNSPNIGMVCVACHTFHMGANTGTDMLDIMRAAGTNCALHVADTMGPPPQPRPALHHQPAGQPVRVHQHLKIGDGDVDWDQFFSGLAEIGFYDRPDTVMIPSVVFAEDETPTKSPNYHHHVRLRQEIWKAEMTNTIQPLAQQHCLPRGFRVSRHRVTNPATGLGHRPGRPGLGRGRPHRDRRGGRSVPGPGGTPR